jgi:15-cis-phytoene synthase
MEADWEHRLLGLAGEARLQVQRAPAVHLPGDPALQAAYELAASLTREHSKSFHMASALLPAPKRQAVRALYAFCRTVDDIVDRDSGRNIPADLEAWRQVVRGALTPDLGPIAAAWMDTQARFQIPRHYALQLIDGVASDQGVTRYRSFDELSTYCYAVASTVGLMSMHIVGFESTHAFRYAIRLGVALQLTNILRDVGEDLRGGRIYLPQNELQAFDIREADMAEGRITAGWRGFMRFQIDRARRLYEEAWPGIGMLHPDGQLAIAAAARLYEGILGSIEANDYDVFSRRASLGALRKLSMIPGLFFEVRGRRLPSFA